MKVSRRREERERRRLPMAERLEPRLLYSADALGPLAPLLDATEPARDVDDEVRALLADPPPPESPSASAVPADIGPGHVVFVDASVPDSARIARELADTGARVVTVGADEDGLLAVSATLAGEDDVVAVHLFGHGESGAQRLGAATLDGAALEANAAGIARWGEALGPGGDILLYGCDVGAGEAGLRLVGELAALSGADVAASDDRTGHAAAGGDWTLERASGAIEADVLDGTEVGADWEHALGEIVISNLADGITVTPGSMTVEQLADWQEEDPDNNRATLRDALIAARVDGGADRIVLVEGRYELTIGGRNEDASLAGDLDVEDTLVIVGSDAGWSIVDANGGDRVFDVLGSGRLTLDTVAVLNGDSGSRAGGAIAVDTGGTLTLDGAAVENSKSDGGDGGGGVYGDDGTTLTIRESSFHGNRALSGSGGGIHARGDLTLEDSTLVFNHAENGNGGGLYVRTDTTVTGSFFSENTARDHGGGIEARGNLTLISSVLHRNEAAEGAGGARIEGWGVLTDVGVDRNEAEHAGGIEMKGGGTFDRVSFTGNEATGQDAGALRLDSGEDVDITNATFSGNTADESGGAIVVRGNATLTLTNATFVGNTDDDDAGAIFMNDGTAVLRNSVFVGNRSDGGGGDFEGDVVSAGFNAFERDVGVVMKVGDREGLGAAALDLGPLVDVGAPLGVSGGHVQGHLPGPDSVLRDAGGTVADGRDAAGDGRDALPDIGAVEQPGGGEALYYVNDDREIVRVGLSLENPQVIAVTVGPTGATDIAVDVEGGRLYWLESGGTRIVTADLDGQDRVVLPGTFEPIDALAVDTEGRRLFVAVGVGAGRIESAPLDVGPALTFATVVSTGIHDPVDVVVRPAAAGAPARVYWAEQGGGGVARGVYSANATGRDDDIRRHTSDAEMAGVVLNGVAVTPDGARVFFSDVFNGRLGYTGDDEVSPAGETGGVPSVLPDALVHAPDADRVVRATGIAGSLVATDENLAGNAVLRAAEDVPLAADVASSSGAGGANGAPTFSPDPLATLTVDEGDDVALSDAGLTAGDDATPVEDLLWRVDTPPAHGRIDILGVAEDVELFTQGQVAAGDVVYVHTGTGPETSDTFTLFVGDTLDESGPLTFEVGIELTDDPPTSSVASPAITVPENGIEPITAAVLGLKDSDTDPADVDVVVLEASGGEIRVTGETGARSSFTLADLEGGRVSYVHGGDENRDERIRLSIADATSTPFETSIAVTVDPGNDPPRLVGTLAPIEAREGVPFALTLSAAGWDDPDPGDSLTLAVSVRPEGDVSSTAPSPGPVPPSVPGASATGDIELPGWLSFDPATATLSGTPGFGDAGRYAVSVVATDAAGASAAPLETTLVVEDVNRPPQVTRLLGGAVDENVVGATVGTLIVGDPDAGDAVTLAVEDDPRFVLDGRELRLADGVSLDHEAVAVERVTIVASDGESDVRRTFDVVVRDVADGPTARADAITVAEGGASDTLDGGADSVLANDGLGADGARVTLVEGPRFGTLALEADGTFRYEHDGGESRADAFEYAVRDASGQVSTTTVSIVATPVNDAPVAVGTLAAAGAEEGRPFALDIATDLWRDEDPGDALSVTVSRADGGDLPPWLAFDAASGRLSGTPSTGDVGTLELRVEARDAAGAAAGPLAFSLVVAPVDGAPAAPVLVGGAVAENVPGAVVGTLDAADEAPAEALAFDVDDPRFVIEGRTLRLADGVALDFESGSRVEIEIGVTDPAGQRTAARLTVEVLDGNDAPTLAGRPLTPDALPAGSAFALPAGTFVDADRDDLTFSATLADGSALPAWLAFDPAGPAFTVLDGASGATDGDAVTVRLIADDGRGGTATLALELRRAPPAPEPLLAPAEPEPQVPTPFAPPAPDAASPSPNGAPVDARTAPAVVPDAVAPQAVDASASALETAAAVELEIETVDLQSLLDGAPVAVRIALADTGEATERTPGLERRSLEEPDVDTIDLASLLGAESAGARRGLDDLAEAFERERDAMEERASFARTVVGGSVGVTSGLSVGYLVWLVRGGTLMGSVLSSLPAWRFVDPLPVLGTLADDADTDGESLESLVDGDGRGPSPRGVDAAVGPPDGTTGPGSGAAPNDGSPVPHQD